MLDGYDERAHAVIHAAIELARPSGSLGPLHLLVALAETPGATSQIPGAEAAHLHSIVLGDDLPPGNSVAFDFRARQVMGSAQQWASAYATLVSPEHLIVALAEQGDADVIAACAAANVDLASARDSAIAVLGWPAEHSRSLEALCPAGTMDRPPLPVSELPDAVWATALQRLDRLPLSRIQRPWHWEALSRNEQRFAWRLADKHSLDDDQQYSLLHHYGVAVDDRAVHAIPHVMPCRPMPADGPLLALKQVGRVARGWRASTEFLTGWACWFGNRRAGMRDRWFRVTWRY